jgi:hypothetical protein
MSVKKKVKKKRVVKPKVDWESTLADSNMRLAEAIDCLKHYTKKDQIGDLANPAIELLTKWGIQL